MPPLARMATVGYRRMFQRLRCLQLGDHWSWGRLQHPHVLVCWCCQVLMLAEPVLCCRYSQAAGQALVVSASADGSVRVWSSSWTCLRIFTTPMSRGGPMQAPGDMPGSPSWRYTAAALSSTATRTHAIAGGCRLVAVYPWQV